MSDEPKIRVAKLSEFRPQAANANKHTQRGLGMLDASMSEVGYVAPMTAAADNEVIDGSARLERAAERFGVDAEVLVIQHDGTRPIVAIREDVPNAETQIAKKISYASNRIGEADLSFDAAQIAADLEAGVDLSGLWSDEELTNLLSGITGPNDSDWLQAFEGNAPGELNTRNITFVVPLSAVETIQNALTLFGNDKNVALIEMAEQCLNSSSSQ